MNEDESEAQREINHLMSLIESGDNSDYVYACSLVDEGIYVDDFSNTQLKQLLKQLNLRLSRASNSTAVTHYKHIISLGMHNHYSLFAWFTLMHFTNT